MVDYADAGGRVFASHWQHSWLHKSTNASWVGAATWNHEEDLKEPIDATIDMGFTKGDAMARWLHFARNNTGTLGIISIDDAQHTIDAVNASVAKSWITIANPIEEDDDTTSASIQYFTMNTPTNVAPASQCGRVVVSDLHLSPNASGNDGTTSRDDVDADFPAGCTSTNFLDQQKLLAFMLFDLTACIQPDQTPSCNALTCQQQGFNCGRAGDGCGNEIVGGCGTCQNGQICGYGGNANVCGGPTCTPIAACPPGYTCGQYPNGCGGLINCGTCTVPGQTCGGGGVANQCGAPVCQTKTCGQLGVSCGDTTNGCSGTQNCGNCVPGTTTCGGGGSAGVCGAPPCTKKTCAPNQCGSMPDGCGGVLTCNPCPQGQTCGGGGQANVCGTASCTVKTCAEVGATCGQASNGCGGVTANCGTCPVGQVCFNNVCSTPQCTPTTCAAQGVACGPLADGCGGLLQCGPCANGQTCGGGGVPGQCGGPTCTARTCAELGATCGQVADGCGGLTPNCGSCPGTQVCNNGVCQTACAPRTCAEANANCGSVADGCGGLLDCGPCTVPGQTCGGGGVPNQCGSGGVIK